MYEEEGGQARVDGGNNFGIEVPIWKN